MTDLEPKHLPVLVQSYEKAYSEKRLWVKVKRFATVAGREVVEKVLCLFYAAQRPETPVWAKTVVYSALGYFILPLDVVPDLTPAIGFTDDVGALALALATIAAYVNQEVKDKASEKIKTWFKE